MGLRASIGSRFGTHKGPNQKSRPQSHMQASDETRHNEHVPSSQTSNKGFGLFRRKTTDGNRPDKSSASSTLGRTASILKKNISRPVSATSRNSGASFERHGPPWRSSSQSTNRNRFSNDFSNMPGTSGGMPPSAWDHRYDNQAQEPHLPDKTFDYQPHGRFGARTFSIRSPQVSPQNSPVRHSMYNETYPRQTQSIQYYEGSKARSPGMSRQYRHSFGRETPPVHPGAPHLPHQSSLVTHAIATPVGAASPQRIAFSRHLQPSDQYQREAVREPQSQSQPRPSYPVSSHMNHISSYSTSPRPANGFQTKPQHALSRGTTRAGYYANGSHGQIEESSDWSKVPSSNQWTHSSRASHSKQHHTANIPASAMPLAGAASALYSSPSQRTSRELSHNGYGAPLTSHPSGSRRESKIDGSPHTNAEMSSEKRRRSPPSTQATQRLYAAAELPSKRLTGPTPQQIQGLVQSELVAAEHLDRQIGNQIVAMNQQRPAITAKRQRIEQSIENARGWIKWIQSSATDPNRNLRYSDPELRQKGDAASAWLADGSIEALKACKKQEAELDLSIQALKESRKKEMKAHLLRVRHYGPQAIENQGWMGELGKITGSDVVSRAERLAEKWKISFDVEDKVDAIVGLLGNVAKQHDK